MNGIQAAFGDNNRADRDPRWRVPHAQHQRIEPGQRYWWENGSRTDPVLVVKVVRRGRLPFETPQGEAVCTSGSCACFVHGESFAYGWRGSAPAPVDMDWISFSGAGVLDHAAWLRARGGPVIELPRGSPVPALVADCIDRFIDDPHRSDLGPALHQLVLACAAAQEAGRREQMSALDLACERLRHQPLTVPGVAALAVEAGVSREHLGRAFQARYGHSPGRWLARHRLGHACYLLRETDLAVASIAQQCGYGSANGLARALREATGQAPRSWRRTTRDGW